MNNSKARWLIIAGLVFAPVGTGMAAWHFWRVSRDLEAELARVKTMAMAQPAKDPSIDLASSSTQTPPQADGQSSVKDLREKLAKLTRENASLKRENARTAPATARGAALDGSGERPTNWREFRQQVRQEYLEKLKATDPEQYEKAMKDEENRRQWFQAASQRFGSRIADQHQFLAELNTAAMSDEQQTQHEKLIDTVSKMNELSEKIAATEDATERGNLERQRFDMARSAREGFDSARDAALADLGRRLGYDDTEAKQLADYVKRVYDMTSMGRMGGGGRGGVPGGGGGAGNRRGGN